jgi:hypothetical protein
LTYPSSLNFTKGSNASGAPPHTTLCVCKTCKQEIPNWRTCQRLARKATYNTQGQVNGGRFYLVLFKRLILQNVFNVLYDERSLLRPSVCSFSKRSPKLISNFRSRYLRLGCFVCACGRDIPYGENVGISGVADLQCFQGSDEAVFIDGLR